MQLVSFDYRHINFDNVEQIIYREDPGGDYYEITFISGDNMILGGDDDAETLRRYLDKHEQMC